MKTFNLNSFRIALMACLMVSLTLVSCKKDDDETTPTTTTGFRGVTINYNDLTSTTPYNTPLFYNNDGDSTVDRNEGHNRLKMLTALDAYGKTANSGTPTLYASTFSNMFVNQNDPFTGTYLALNDSIENLREATAISKTFAQRDATLDVFSTYFSNIATASLSVNNTASSGVAGKLSNAGGSKYLVDEKGIEYIQVISKSFIGAFQLDYISNVLLNTGLNADNTKLVEGEKYTALEHNWDVAYGSLTLNSYYGAKEVTTPTPRSGESFLGSYIWEYNRTGYAKIHMAFLKGRAAIINNDMTEVRTQAALIRGIMEETVARAANGYLGKWSTNSTDDGARAHAIGEGAGFIYSLRYCSVNGANDTFSDDIITDLGLYTGNGFWDLTVDKINTAKTAISNQFGI